MMLVIRTQDRENYAAHQGFDGTYYWKNKGGSEYKVKNIPSVSDEGLTAIVLSLRSQIEQDNDYFQTTIIDWSIESDSYLSQFERSQLEYDGEITFKEPILNYEEIVNG
jgi:ABC-type uncharacterized transport system involved in gliding motility auxiliary subunit